MANIGYAALSIIPSMQGVGTRLSTGLATSFDGKRAGERVGDDVSKGLGSKMGKLGGVVKAGLLGAGVAGGAALLTGIGTALDKGALNDKLAASLGATPGEAKRLGDVAGRLYAGAWGDNLEDVSTAVGAVQTSLKGLGTADLERITASTLDMANAFGIDVTRAAQVAGQAVTTGLARDGGNAVDLLVTSLQQVPTALREDLLDAVDEYGPSFQALGIGGEQAFGLLVAASEKGMYGIDKTGDALKEFTLRAGNIGDTGAQQAFETLGLSGEDMARRIVAGGGEASGAFDAIVSSLLGMEDPAQRATTAVALFGTPLEDLGVTEIPKFLESLQGTANSLGDVEGAAENFGETLNGNPKTRLVEFGRTVRSEIADAINNYAIPALAGVVGFLNDNLSPVLSDVKDDLTSLNLDGIGDFFSGLDSEYDFSGIYTGLRDSLVGALADLPGDLRDAVGRSDWGEVGSVIGTGIAETANALVAAQDEFGDAIFGLISAAILNVDWPQLALAVGKQVPALLIGFVTGLLNFDIGAVWDVVSNNWVEVLLGVLGVAFAPAKFIGPIANILRKIPFVGRFAAWLLEGVNTLGGKVLQFAKDLFGRFSEGFAAAGPSLIGRVADVFRTLGIRLFVWADDTVIWFKNLPGRFSAWMGDLAERLGVGARTLVTRVTDSFGNLWSTGRALFEAGVRAIVTKFAELFPNFTRAVGNINRQVGSAFRGFLNGAAEIFRTGVATISGVFLGLVGTLLEGAADAFSWVPGIGPKLETAAAKFNTFKNNVNASIRGIDAERNVKIRAELDATAAALVRSGASPAVAAQRTKVGNRATGGSVFGPGTGTSDSIPTMLSNGEHVWTAREVSAAGGHAAVEAMRNGVLHRATGGPVTYGTVSPKKWKELLDAGWRGRAGDHDERLYPPASTTGNGGSVLQGQVSAAEWDRLLGSGWKGIAGDRAERLYSPVARARLTGPGVNPRADTGGTAAFDTMARQLNSGVTALGKTMQGTVDGLARKQAAAAAVANTGGAASASGRGPGGKTVAELISFARLWKSRGITVSENRILGDNPRPGAHSATGYHYKYGNSGAVDFNAGAGESTGEKRRLVPVVQDALRKGFGAQFLASGHYNHAHVDVGSYRAVGNMSRYFDRGGIAKGSGYLPKATLAPERVLDPRQTQAFERLVGVLDRQPAREYARAPEQDQVHFHLDEAVAARTAAGYVDAVAVRRQRQQSIRARYGG